MRDTDLDVVMDIEQASFSTPWSRGSFRNLLARRDADLWVAIIAEAVAGYAVVWYVAGEAELGNLCVTPAFRGRGIGGSLLDWSIESARKHKAQRLFLEVRSSNRIAQALYGRRGFVSVGWRRRYYRNPVEDAKVMCLDLAAES